MNWKATQAQGNKLCNGWWGSKIQCANSLQVHTGISLFELILICTHINLILAGWVTRQVEKIACLTHVDDICHSDQSQKTSLPKAAKCSCVCVVVSQHWFLWLFSWNWGLQTNGIMWKMSHFMSHLASLFFIDTIALFGRFFSFSVSKFSNSLSVRSCWHINSWICFGLCFFHLLLWVCSVHEDWSNKLVIVACSKLFSSLLCFLLVLWMQVWAFWVMSD